MTTFTRMTLTFAASLLVAAAGYSPATLAQATLPNLDLSSGLAKTAEPSDQWTFTLGLGAGAAPDYEGGDDYEAVPIPIARAQKGSRFAKLVGLHVTSNLLNSPNWRLGPSLNFRQGYSDVDNDRVDSLHDRGNSVEVGVKGGYVFKLQQDRIVDLSLEVLGDVSSGHDGFLYTPRADFKTPLDARWDLAVGGKTTYASGSYMSHYFSINSEDSARSGLDNFDADADFKSAAAHVLLSYELSKKWHLLGYAEYKRMLGDAADSPVVDDEGDENQYFGAVAVTYTWD